MSAEGRDAERVHFICSTSLVETANREAEEITRKLRSVLPSAAEILHVGATSIPGCLTKGDLDLVVRIDRGDFFAARDALDATCSKNLDSARDESFASYVIEGRRLPVGVQLVVRGSMHDQFHIFWMRMRASPELREDYNRLKRQWNGGDMEDYRAAKSEFIASTVGELAELRDQQ